MFEIIYRKNTKIK